MIQLRPYQLRDKLAIYSEWLRCQTVLHRADTGYGKTAVIAAIVSEHAGASVIIAHRDTIVAQLSLMLARFGIRHNIIADPKNCRQIADLHVKATGRNYYDPGARAAVASVDTLIRRKDLEQWAAQVTFATVDEGHHVVIDNKWHRALQLFTHPALKILLPTATPKRADNKGLGRDADGIADCMVLGPPMAWLMEQGYLTRYHPPILANSHYEEALGKVGASGDWSNAQQRKAAQQSTIVGDVPQTYANINAGYYRDIPASPAGRPRLAVVFAADVETATEILQEFRKRNVRAELLTGETDAGVRRRVFDDFAKRIIHVIVAVDIISEGTDMPAVEIIIQARATASLAVYMQQFGRGLRPMWSPTIGHNGGPPLDEPPMDQTEAAQALRLASIANSTKPALIFVDHVGNFLRHGPPDRHREWTLERIGSKSNGPSGAIPMRACLNPECAHPYERVLSACPYCCTPAPPPAGRSGPDMVEGDMVMLDPAVLAAMLGAAQEATMSVDAYRHKLAASGLPQRFIMANVKHHDAKLKTQTALLDVMAYWGGFQRAAGYDDRAIQKLFWFRFGVDVLTAQTLGTAETEALIARVALDAGSN